MTEKTLRPESSVAVGLNEDGEIVFPCDRCGPVRHRTPEELGIARVLPPDGLKRATGRTDLGPGSLGRDRAIRHGRDELIAGVADAASVNARAEKVELRTIRGVDVLMPANAVMGAEMIDLLAGEASVGASVGVVAE